MEDNQLKEILSHTVLKTDENLKHRVMHQINYEKNLAPLKSSNSTSLFDKLFRVFSIMYSLIALLAVYFYFKVEINPLKSTTFIVSAVLISFIFSIYWLLIVYEDYRNQKQISSLTNRLARNLK